MEQSILSLEVVSTYLKNKIKLLVINFNALQYLSDVLHNLLRLIIINILTKMYK